jgi:RHS repeat-associated protein
VYFGGKRIARRDLPSGAVHYYFSDHLNSTNLVYSASGALEEDSDFYPYGGERAYVLVSGNHFKFTGKERDPESGLDYFGARYYGNSVGRFLTPDWADKPTAVPYGEFGDPQSLNLYSYVKNTPVTKPDLDGHCATLCFGGIGAAAGAIIYGGGDIYFQWKAGNKIDWKQAGKEAVKGAAVGFVVGATVGLASKGIAPEIQDSPSSRKKSEDEQTEQSQPSEDLRRPYIRKDTRQAVEDAATRTPDGRPIDPNTRQPIDGKPDLGHKHGNEFWREKKQAQEQGLTQKEFNERMNDPNKYQLEDSSSNRSRKYEKKD